jgi:hypothetical protein
MGHIANQPTNGRIDGNDRLCHRAQTWVGIVKQGQDCHEQ